MKARAGTHQYTMLLNKMVSTSVTTSCVTIEDRTKMGIEYMHAVCCFSTMLFARQADFTSLVVPAATVVTQRNSSAAKMGVLFIFT